MSSHKLYNYEVAPPAEAWERIAQELEGVNEYRNLSQKLQNLQVAAPVLAWENISGELDDEKSFEIIGKKLSSVAVAPPADVWGKIQENLSITLPVTKKEAPVIPLKIRISKYAAAAAVIGILVLSAYFLAQRSSQDVDTIQKSFADNTSVIKSADQPIAKADLQDKIKLQKTSIVADSAQRHAALPLASQNEGVLTTSNGNSYSTTVEKNREVDGRYIVLMTEEGNVVRMNKKVSGMADCIAGEDVSQECNNKIEEWQKELAAMPVLASPDNILGLLELANKPVAGL